MSEAQLIVGLSLLGAALSLDVTAALQLMLSQPIAAGGLAGLLVGDPGLGLLIGAALQLVWTGVLPVGAAPFPDGAASSVVGVGTAVLLTRAGSPDGLGVALGILTALLCGLASQSLTTLVRRRNVGFAAVAERSAAAGDPRGVRVAVSLALGTRFASSAVLAGVFLTAVWLGSPFSVVNVTGSFPALIWAAPVAVGALLVGKRVRWEAGFLGAGIVVGLIAAVLF